MSNSVRNPYYNIGSIDEPALFFGRSSDMERLLTAVFSETPQCRSIVGQRKIGKTSLVKHLSRTEIIQDFGFQPEGYLFVYFNCQKVPSALKSANDFYRELIKLVIQKIPGRVRRFLSTSSIRLNSSDLGNEWESLLKKLAKQRFRIIVIFDEFEKAVISKPLIEGGLFGSLRGYTQDNPNFAWITCTMYYLQDLFRQSFDEFDISPMQRKSESDFYNIAPAHPLSLFDREDTLMLIGSPSEERGIKFGSEDVERIIEMSGDFPYFIQRSCHYFFDAYLNDAYEPASILEDYLREAESFWEGYWDKLDIKEQKSLLEIAEGREAEIFQIEKLKELSLVYEDVYGVTTPFSLEFGHFIRQRSKFYPITDGAVSPTEQPSDLEQDHSPSSEYNIAVITSTQSELSSILNLTNYYDQLKTPDDSNSYFAGELKNTEIKIIITKSPFMGMCAATCSTTKLILKYRPRYIFMVGIAAGNKNITKLGDILIAEQSIDYNQVIEIERKNQTPDQRYMQRAITLDGNLKNKLELFAHDPTIKESIYKEYPNHSLFKIPKCHFGVMATGSSLLRSQAKMEKLIRLYHGFIGLDMETYGVYYAAQNALQDLKPVCVSVKSVSDFGENTPIKTSSDERREYALHTSSKFFYEFVANAKLN